MDGCTFAEGSTLELAKKTDIKYMSSNNMANEFKDISYTIKNVELKEKSCIRTYFEAHWPDGLDYKEPDNSRHITINNVIATGNNNLKGFPLSELNNSLLENTNLYCSLPEVKINNTILKNSAYLNYINEVNNSEIYDSQITAKKPMAISDQFLKKEKIEDYEKFLNPNGEYLANDIGRVTNKISPL